MTKGCDVFLISPQAKEECSADFIRSVSFMDRRWMETSWDEARQVTVNNDVQLSWLQVRWLDCCA